MGGKTEVQNTQSNAFPHSLGRLTPKTLPPLSAQPSSARRRIYCWVTRPKTYRFAAPCDVSGR